jgi:hypothetical protein
VSDAAVGAGMIRLPCFFELKLVQWCVSLMCVCVKFEPELAVRWLIA